MFFFVLKNLIRQENFESLTIFGDFYVSTLRGGDETCSAD